MPTSHPFVVQQSFPDPRPTTNPYLVQLQRSLTALPGVQIRTFTWRRALLGRYDVFHVHWPEILVAGQSPPKAAVRQLLTLALVARWAIGRVPLVRTRHNVELPDGISRRERALLRLIERVTTAGIVLNPDTPDRGRPAALIPHGHYRDWFAEIPRTEVRPGRMAFIGLVRRYKGVEQLLDAFAQIDDPRLTLRVAGRPSTDGLADAVRERAAADRRISVHLEFLSDAELVAEVGAAELVVLPYREMHNSGGALTALSLDRPVLVPDNPVTRALAAEVGPGWVVTYRHPLTPADLTRALDDVRRRAPGTRPDLTGRGWDLAGAAHVAAYREAVRLRRGTAGPLQAADAGPGPV